METVEIYWLWGIVGLTLLGVEMLTGTLYILWFAIAALIIGLLTWLYPDMALTLQLFAYAVLSLGTLYVYHHFYNKNDREYKVGQSQGDEVGTVGEVIEIISPHQVGRIKFAQGVMGSREWAAVSEETLNVGMSAKIVAIEGNTLRVTAIH